ncbi:MAG TPA: S8 family serine peptidase, partial [Chthoniobacteraceae bacterium]|nr:S8 family serine peptidase [Chthoniobacteraceae bacterium]
MLLISLMPAMLAPAARAAEPAPFSDEVRLQIAELQAEKSTRTPAQQKMESRLIYAVKRHGKVPFSARMEKVLQKTVTVEADGAALVDISATVTPELLGALRAAGAQGIVSVPRFRAVRARVPLGAIEKLAARADVKFIKQAAPAFTHTGPINSQGDTAHGTGGATGARAISNVTGLGVKIGVISDSADYLANSQSTGELGPVTVLDDFPGETGEGTAMLEIVHDLAPGAELFFATAYHSEASFAQNILNLRAAGCDIIIDDVGYFDESPFQNGPVAEAVEQVSADGALVFSAAGNEGNKDRGTSGTWEGDFADGGATTAPISKAGRLHSFGGLSYNVVTATGFGETLFWTDPLGASNNDYDLYVLSSDGTSIVAFSNTTQNGSQDPVEVIAQSQQPISAGMRLIVVKAASAAPRFLQVSTLRGTLTTSTNGKVAGHAACPSVLSVAAVSASAGTAFTTANRVETFSSDGPRRFFYNTDGTPITPGNLSATGGRVLQKPDIAAADRVATSVPGFSSFAGTSAAAPHAGAIAALLKSQNLKMTSQELRAALIANAIDIEGPGVDRDTGYGIVRPGPTLLTLPAGAKVEKVSVSIAAESFLPPNGAPDPGEQVTVALALRNTGGAANGNVRATLLPAPGLTNVTGPQTFALGAGQTDTKNFSFTANAVLGGKITLTFAIADDAVTYAPVTQTFALGSLGAPQTFSNAAQITINDYAGGTTSAAATPYPSTIDVAGVNGSVGKVTVRLNGFSHTYPGDVKVMLVSPNGTPVMLMAYGGGGTNASSTNLTFDDAGSTNFTPSVSGTYHPIDNSLGGLFGDPFPAPAPDTYFTELAAFIGNTANGTWSLYVVDDGPGDIGMIDGGWTLNITPVVYSNPAVAGADLAVAMAASSPVVTSDQEIVYTVTVSNNGTADATGVQVSDALPQGLALVSLTASQGSSSNLGNLLMAALGTIPAKGFATVTIHATPTQNGAFSNTASATTTAVDIDPTNNSATLGGLTGAPNLTLVQPAGWSDRIVLSSVTGTNTDSGLVTDPRYLDFAVGNVGTADANAYFTMKLFIDGVLTRTIQRQLALAVNGVYRVEDIPIPALTAGPHAIRVQVDTTGAVSESNEL